MIESIEPKRFEKLPKETLCVTVPTTEQLDDPYYVPIPSFERLELFQLPKRSKDLENHFSRSSYFAIRHPKCELGVLCMLDFYTVMVDGPISFSSNLMFRIKPKIMKVLGDNVEKIVFEYVKEKPPTEKEFNSEEFQEKLDRLRVVMLSVVYSGDVPLDDIEPVPVDQLGVNTDTVGGFIDEIISMGMLLSPYGETEDKLMAVLDELNVVRRLDKAIIAAEHCLFVVKALKKRNKKNKKRKRRKGKKPKKVKIKPRTDKGKREMKSDKSSDENLVRKILFSSDQSTKKSDKLDCIHINRSPKSDLEKLSGVGQAIARNIINTRKRRLFSSLDDLMRVNGINKNVVDKIRNQGLVCGEKTLPNPESLNIEGIQSLRDYLSNRVIGQPRAIDNISRSVSTAAAGMQPDNRPLMVLFFAGPTGVGKTEIAESFADYLFYREKKLGIKTNGKKPLVKVDSGQYGGTMNFAVSNLIGSPPGYVGSKGTGDNSQPPLLSKRNFPDDRITVLLFDEIEKAFSGFPGGPLTQSSIGRLLITILDKAELTNNWDEKVNLRNSIIIFTSNIGAKDIVKAANKGIGFDYRSKSTDKESDEDYVDRLNEEIFQLTKKEYEKSFMPELRNRMDRLVVFRFLTRSNFIRISNKELSSLKRDIKKKHNIDIFVHDSVREWLLNHGIVRDMGVRSLQRTINTKIRAPLASYVLSGSNLSEGDVVQVYSNDPEDKDKDPVFKVF